MCKQVWAIHRSSPCPEQDGMRSARAACEAMGVDPYLPLVKKLWPPLHTLFDFVSWACKLGLVCVCVCLVACFGCSSVKRSPGALIINGRFIKLYRRVDFVERAVECV